MIDLDLRLDDKIADATRSVVEALERVAERLALRRAKRYRDDHRAAGWIARDLATGNTVDWFMSSRWRRALGIR